MKVQVLAVARLELLEGFEHCERIHDRLGRRSWDEVEELIAWFAQNSGKFGGSDGAEL